MSDRDPEQARRELVGLLAGEREAQISCDAAMLALADSSLNAIDRGTPVAGIGEDLHDVARACSALIGQYAELLTASTSLGKRGRRAARGEVDGQEVVRIAVELEDLTARFTQLQAAGEQLAAQLQATPPPRLSAVESPPSPSRGGLRIVPPA